MYTKIIKSIVLHENCYRQARIGGGIQIPETKLQPLLPFPTPLPEHTGELARRLIVINRCIPKDASRASHQLFWVPENFYNCISLTEPKTDFCFVYQTKAYMYVLFTLLQNASQLSYCCIIAPLP